MIQLLWKPVRQLIKLLNISYNMTQQFHFQVNIPKKIESIRPHRNMYMNVKCPMDTDLQLLAVLPSFWIVPDQSRRFIRGPISHQVRHVITPALLHNTCLQLSQHVHATYLEFQSFLYGNSMYSGTGNLVQIPAPLDGFLTSSPIYTNPMVLVYSSKWEMKTYDKLDILLETAL